MARKNKPNHVSKEYLLKSLVTLMQETAYDNISITDITSAAGVSRMAYYRNYARKDEIITKYVLAVAVDVNEKTPGDWLVTLFKELSEECLALECALGRAIENAHCHQLLSESVYTALVQKFGEDAVKDSAWVSIMIGAFCGAFISCSKEGSADLVKVYTRKLESLASI